MGVKLTFRVPDEVSADSSKETEKVIVPSVIVLSKKDNNVLHAEEISRIVVDDKDHDGLPMGAIIVENDNLQLAVLMGFDDLKQFSVELGKYVKLDENKRRKPLTKDEK